MANTDIKFNADASAAIKEIDRLAGKLEALGNKFQDQFSRMSDYAKGLGTALVGLGAVVANFADEIVDVATANELAVEQVLAFSRALEANGGKADSTAQILQRFSNSVESANSGNMKMVETMGRLGVSITDLGTLSNTELKDKLLANLAKIEDPMTRNAVATDIFGKAILGVDLKKFAGDQAALTREMAPYAASLQDAADAWDSIVQIFGKIKLAFAEAFNPIFKVIKDLRVDIDYLVVGFRLLGAALAVMVGAAVIGGLTKLITLMRTLNVVVSKNPLVTIAGALVGLGTATAAYLGLGKSVEEKQKDIEAAIKKEGEAKKNVKRDQEGLNDVLKKEQDTLKQVNDTLSSNWRKALDRYNIEFKNLGLSEEQKKSAEAKAQIEQDAADARLQLDQKFQAMNAAAQARNKSLYDEEKKAIDANAEAQKRAVDQRLESIARLKQAQEDLYGSIGIRTAGVLEFARKEIDQIKEQTFNMNDRIRIENDFNAVVQERQLILSKLGSMSDIDRMAVSQALDKAIVKTGELARAGGDVQRAFQDAFLAEMQQTNASRSARDKVFEGLAGQRNAISEVTEVLTNQAQLNNSLARQFTTGWNKAFGEYVNSATNAADQAYRMFQKITQGMEDLIVNFAKTGKFEWKNFVASMAEELLRSNIRQLLAQTFGGVGGGQAGSMLGTLWSGFKGLLGFANGGMIPTNGPVIVGERGPEVISGAAGRYVTPNNQLGGTVVYNINAVDALSFKQLVARDPGFIHAVALQGSRTVPGVR
jgi:lambda family phage tail tape measure protein